MGFRSLVEFNHDDIRAIVREPDLFALELERYIKSGSEQQRSALETFNATVIAMRHSYDYYIIASTTPGFPTMLPFEDFLAHRRDKVNQARKMLNIKPRPSRDKLENMITSLVEIIERLEEGETTAS